MPPPTCRLGGVVKVMNWCVLAIAFISSGAAVMYPTFQPVRLKLLPAEPMRTVRSRMPSNVISEICRRSSKMMCS